MLVFNCTSGRTGNTFLGAMFAKAAEQLKQYGRTEEAGSLFDQVIFCVNVTYADGRFKGGSYSTASLQATSAHVPPLGRSHHGGAD